MSKINIQVKEKRKKRIQFFGVLRICGSRNRSRNFTKLGCTIGNSKKLVFALFELVGFWNLIQNNVFFTFWKNSYQVHLFKKSRFLKKFHFFLNKNSFWGIRSRIPSQNYFSKKSKTGFTKLSGHRNTKKTAKHMDCDRSLWGFHFSDFSKC